MRRRVTVIGGGIVGLATARELLVRFPGIQLTVLEKEARVGVHQTGHNSGVLHSGVYYRPGSLKAKHCVAGAKLMGEFCAAHRIPHQLCGKLIVATAAAELPILEMLYLRGQANGVAGLSMVGPERLRELEPHARGMQALHIASAGTVDFAAVAQVLADEIRRLGGDIQTSTRVQQTIRRKGEWVVETSRGATRSEYLVTCAGLYADRVAAKSGARPAVRIMPFRGEYYDLVPARNFLVQTMLYPVPNPALPFLGAHFTRTASGTVQVGPNAVLALKREGYRKSDISLLDVFEMLRFPGFWRMARRHWAAGAAESYRSLSKRAFTRSLQRLVPELQPDDLCPGTTGVRAQAVDIGGHLLDDFHIVRGQGAIHVCHVPSPAATASLSLAREIVDLACSAFGLAEYGEQKVLAS